MISNESTSGATVDVGVVTRVVVAFVVVVVELASFVADTVVDKDVVVSFDVVMFADVLVDVVSSEVVVVVLGKKTKVRYVK